MLFQLQQYVRLRQEFITFEFSADFGLSIHLSKTDAFSIGEVLYINYGIIVLLGGINLLVAMVGVIYLILLNYPIRKTQSFSLQSRTKTKNSEILNWNFRGDESLEVFSKLDYMELYYFKYLQKNYKNRK